MIHDKSSWPFAALLLSFILWASLFSISLPLNESADEGDHFALVRFIVEPKRAPLTKPERDMLGDKGDASPIYHGLVAWVLQAVMLGLSTDASTWSDLPVQTKAVRYIPYDGFRSFTPRMKLGPGGALSWLGMWLDLSQSCWGRARSASFTLPPVAYIPSNPISP